MINIIELKNKINWQILAKEVTKYNPLFRNSEGVYLKDDWTDFSDIGKIRGGNKRLSYIDYVKIEDKYVSTVKFLFDYYKCEKIQLVSKNIYEDENLRRLRNKDLAAYFPLLINKRTINISEIDYVVRLILRGAFYAELVGKIDRSISVRFSYDFYMFLIFPENDEVINHIVNKIGLFVR